LHIDDGPRRDRWAIVFLAATLYVPPVRALFGFDVLHAIDIAICIGAAIVGTSSSNQAQGGPSSSRRLSGPDRLLQ
jgi:hypothetical protein